MESADDAERVKVALNNTSIPGTNITGIRISFGNHTNLSQVRFLHSCACCGVQVLQGLHQRLCP
jgi:hypothetical protein